MCHCCGRRFKNSRELFDGYKHSIVQEYVETGVLLDGDDNEEDARPELHVVCQLVVNNVILDDCGEVECRAFNSGGMDSTRAQLLIRCTSPQFDVIFLCFVQEQKLSVVLGKNKILAVV